MKILLLKDVRKVGRKGEVVDVSEGYGRNFLIKTGIGKLATGGIVKNIKRKESKQKELELSKKEKELKFFAEINRKTFVIKVNASEKGHLFGALHKKEIANVLEVEEENLILEKDIKKLGEFEIKIHLGGKNGKITLKIEKK